MRKRTLIPLLFVMALFVAIAIALFLRKQSPPEAARLLPESDAIVYVHVKTLRSASHFDETPITRSADFQKFIDATGINPERDIDEAAFALHRMPDPKGPNGPVAYSEVFIGTFDGQRLAKYLEAMATQKETYADRTIYCVPIEGRTLRVAQLGYDTIGASNMPTAEQIHSMVDRARTSAIGTPGSSLLSSHYSEVPILSQAWGIGHIGLPFGDAAKAGQLSLMGFELPLADTTDLIASLRYTSSVKLRVEELAPDETAAQRTVESLTAVLNIMRGISGEQATQTPASNAMRDILTSVEIEQHHDHAILNATATLDQLKALSSAPTPPQPTPTLDPAPIPAKAASPKRPMPSK